MPPIIPNVSLEHLLRVVLKSLQWFAIILVWWLSVWTMTLKTEDKRLPKGGIDESDGF